AGPYGFKHGLEPMLTYHCMLIFFLLMAVRPGLVTAIDPVVAPGGTVASAVVEQRKRCTHSFERDGSRSDAFTSLEQGYRTPIAGTPRPANRPRRKCTIHPAPPGK